VNFSEAYILATLLGLEPEEAQLFAKGCQHAEELIDLAADYAATIYRHG
jgi:hypothetical protein